MEESCSLPGAGSREREREREEPGGKYTLPGHALSDLPLLAMNLLSEHSSPMIQSHFKAPLLNMRLLGEHSSFPLEVEDMVR